jgi:hypothetical protein
MKQQLFDFSEAEQIRTQVERLVPRVESGDHTALHEADELIDQAERIAEEFQDFILGHEPTSRTAGYEGYMIVLAISGIELLRRACHRARLCIVGDPRHQYWAASCDIPASIAV